ncbi:MAG: hypothetical protein ABSG19_06130 [Candidatus Aminicenantales bacterium]
MKKASLVFGFAIIGLMGGLNAGLAHAQCQGDPPYKSSNALQDIYCNLQALEANYPFRIQSDPKQIGSMRVATPHGPLEALFHPTGPPGSDGLSSQVSINGLKAVIYVSQDRSQEDVARYTFQVEITEIQGPNGPIFKKVNDWDNWPVLKQASQGNVLSTYFDVGDATLVKGTVRASTLSQPGQPSRRAIDGHFSVEIVRDPDCLALGAFTIPVLPVSLLYAPSAGNTGLTTVTYEDSHTTSMTVKTTIASGDSKATPVPAEYGDLGALVPIMSVMKAAGKAFGPVISGCINFIADGLGSSAATEENGKRQATTTGLLKMKGSLQGQTVGGRNPDGTTARAGDDDRIIILRDLRLGWVVEGSNRLKLVTLGARQEKVVDVRSLKHDLPLLEAQQPPPVQPKPQDTQAVGDLEFGQQAQGDKSTGSTKKVPPLRASQTRPAPAALAGAKGPLQTDLDLESVRALLALDPLAQAGPDLDLGKPPYAGRFQRAAFDTPWAQVDEIDTPFAIDQETVSLITQTTSQENAIFTTRVENDKPGLLGRLLSIGPQTEQKLTSTSSITSTETSEESVKRTVKVHWERSSDEVVLRAFYDSAFDSFFFQEVTDSYLQAQGTATDESGSPQANQWITLRAGDRTILTRTDAQGRYVFYSSNPRAGKGRLTAGRRVVTIDVAPVKAKVRRTPTGSPTGTVSRIPAAQAPQIPSQPAAKPKVSAAGRLPRPITGLKPAAAPENLLSFDPSRLVVKEFKNGWGVIDTASQPERAIAAFAASGRGNAVRALEIIRHYGITQKCVIEPGFSVFLVPDGSQVGTLPAETCRSFNPAALRVENRPAPSKLDVPQPSKMVWAIMSGPSQLFGFGSLPESEARANQALELIRRHGFRNLCHVGGVLYLRK